MTATPTAADARSALTRATDGVGGERVGYAAVVVVTVLWGITPLLVKAIDASPLTILAVRYWIAVPVMLVVARLAGTPFRWGHMKASWFGGLTCTLGQALVFAAFQSTSLANAVIIGAVSPLLIAVVAVPMFGERLSRAQVALMAVTLGAVGVFVASAGDTSGATMAGDLLAVGALVAQTAYLVDVKRSRMAGVPVAGYITGVFIVGAVVATPLSLVWGTSISGLGATDLVYIATIALLMGCVGHGLMSWAQTHVNLGVASTIILGTTVVTAVGAWMFFDEALDALQIAAGAVVLGAIAGILTIQIRQQDDGLTLAELGEPPFAE